MERKKDWKSFRTLVSERPDYREWFQCQDPKKKELRYEFIDLTEKISMYYRKIEKIPVVPSLDEIHITRSSLNIDQSLAIYEFLETLLENFLQEESENNLNLLFAFLETYAGLLENEFHWCILQSIPPE